MSGRQVKERILAFRVDSELHAQFAAAAKQQHTTMTKVLFDAVRAFTKEHRQRLIQEERAELYRQAKEARREMATLRDLRFLERYTLAKNGGAK